MFKSGPTRRGPPKITLHEAALAGDVATIKRILKEDKRSLDSFDDTGNTALHLAVQEGHFGAVQELVLQGAEVNIYNYYGFLPLQVAFENNEIKQFLLQHGAYMPGPLTDLHLAAGAGDDSEIRRILQKERSQLQALDFLGQTPLRAAIIGGHSEAVKTLVAFGAKLNLVDAAGYPPIYYAAQYPQIEKWLISKGATPCDSDFIPIDLGRTELHDAVGEGDVRKIRKLLKQDLSLVNAVDREARTPLHLALLLQENEAAIELINSGADLNLQDAQGMTPLHQAVLNGDILIAGALLKRGADVNVRDYSGDSATEMAVRSENQDMVNLLLSFKPKLDTNYSSQQNIVEIAKQAMKHTPLSKDLKKQIEVPKKILYSIEEIFRKQLLNELTVAKQSNKKVLIMLGEIHGDFKIYQVEKMMIRVARELGFSTLFVEAPLEFAEVPIEIKAREKYGMELVPVDTHPDKEKVSVQERNKYISKEISAKNKEGLLITGSDHLYGLLADRKTAIDSNQFHIIPFNLSSLIERQLDTDEARFSSDKSCVIQVVESAVCFSPIKPVIDRWNKSSKAAQSSLREKSPVKKRERTPFRTLQESDKPTPESKAEIRPYVKTMFKNQYESLELKWAYPEAKTLENMFAKIIKHLNSKGVMLSSEQKELLKEYMEELGSKDTVLKMRPK